MWVVTVAYKNGNKRAVKKEIELNDQALQLAPMPVKVIEESAFHAFRDVLKKVQDGARV